MVNTFPLSTPTLLLSRRLGCILVFKLYSFNIPSWSDSPWKIRVNPHVSLSHTTWYAWFGQNKQFYAFDGPKRLPHCIHSTKNFLVLHSVNSRNPEHPFMLALLNRFECDKWLKVWVCRDLQLPGSYNIKGGLLKHIASEISFWNVQCQCLDYTTLFDVSSKLYDNA